MKNKTENVLFFSEPYNYAYENFLHANHFAYDF